MTSKSFSSKGLLGDSMRRNLWALVLSGVGFFLSLLLPADVDCSSGRWKIVPSGWIT